MGDTHEKGRFRADIPDDAVADALASVERANLAGPDDQPAPDGPPVEPASPAAAEAESLRAQVELSQALGRETQAKLTEVHDRWVRAVADLENYRRRAAKEREEVQKFGVEKLVKDLLPVLDNLDRALAAAAADDPLVAGVKLVKASFEQALARHGVKAFSALGQPFDPVRHEALLQVPSNEPPGTVVLEHARGFTLHERLVRPAMVGVAVAASGGASGGSTDGRGA
jgi:molecular chaperone GrpE